MPSELQAALADTVTELSGSAGELFTAGSVQFLAWPVSAILVRPGRLESAPDSPKTYEAVRSTTPVFKRGDRVTLDSQTHIVGSVGQADPTTGLFRFTIS
jgi:hypothetical protein